MKKRNILKIVIFLLLAILTSYIFIIYSDKVEKIEKQKNECLQQAETPAEKNDCFTRYIH